MLLEFDDLCRIAHKLVGQFADVNQSVLLDAHIHKGAETGDIGDNSRKYYPLNQV